MGACENVGASEYEGAKVGSAVAAVGFRVGESVGLKDGAVLGLSVGNRVGFRVGNVLGRWLGAAEGARVQSGRHVGGLLGWFVTVLVGDDVMPHAIPVPEHCCELSCNRLATVDENGSSPGTLPFGPYSHTDTRDFLSRHSTDAHPTCVVHAHVS